MQVRIRSWKITDTDVRGKSQLSHMSFCDLIHRLHCNCSIVPAVLHAVSS
jgi:hypothetical protein